MAMIVFEDNKETYPIDDDILRFNVKRLTNQVYRLLPAKEEGSDWVKPLETCIIELLGLGDLFPDQPKFLTLVSKLDGLRVSKDDIEFALYRRTIFECCGILNKIEKEL